jgi:hypothetical protein
MPRRFPNGRRRRPGRRPPNRYSGPFDPPARGFTGFGFGPFYRALFPGLRGREKREFFNGIAGWGILGFAFGTAVLGFSQFGVLGAIFGLGAGIAAAGAFAERQRFYRC